MKKSLSLTLLAISTLSSLPLSARPSMENPGFFGDIGLEAFYYRYREVLQNDEFFMQDSGPMYGFYYSFGYQPACMAFRFSLDGHFNGSNSIRYESNGTGEMDNCSYTVNELRLLGTYSWDLQNQWKVEPYTGLAARYLVNDDFDKVSNSGHIGWLRTSTYTYIPVGLRFVNDIEDMQAILHLEYDWFIKGRQVSRSFNSYYNNEQHHGFGARMGVDLLIPSSLGCFDYNVGAFIRYWNIEASTVNVNLLNGTRVGWEPKNTTYEIGLRLGLSF
jgi:hypothetical protein